MILIVDDSLTVRMDLVEALTEAGLDPIGVATLEDARAQLAKHQFAAVILDFNLPDGYGTDLLEELRVPVLMLSTQAEVADRVTALRKGANDYVGKPYDRGDVIARIRRLVEVEDERPCVIVVEPDVTYRIALCHALEGAGYATTVTSTPDEGLRAASAHRPIAIVVDSDDAMIRRVRLDPALRTTPCLLLAHSEADELRALAAGADAFVRKGQDLALVLARLAAVIRSHEAVDDAPSLLAPRRILAVGLTDLPLAGYDVVHASTAEEALELVAVQPVDCVIAAADVSLELVRRVKGGLPDLPVVVHGGSLDAFAAGADDVLTADISPELLSARLQAQIRRKVVEDEQRDRLRVRIEAEGARALERSNAELAAANRELEAFSSSVSHDLRAPLRAIARFTEAAIEDLGQRLDPNSAGHLRRVLSAAGRMTELVDGLLELSRVTGGGIARASVDLSVIAHDVAAELHRRDPDRVVALSIAPHLIADADARLMRVVFDNLLGNAWKFTARRPEAHITVSVQQGVFTVRDDGAGFEPAKAAQLFAPFIRLHSDKDFPGTGIGLATVRRIVERHGGKVWAEGQVGAGAAVNFTLS